MTRQQFGLIKATLHFLTPVQRNWHYGVKPLVNGNRLIEVTGQRPGQGLHARILQQVDQRAQRTFVKSETRGPVKASQTGLAGGAHAVFVQREFVRERSVAAGAEVLGIQRHRSSQTFRTDRNPRPFGQIAITNAAFGGEEK